MKQNGFYIVDTETNQFVGVDWVLGMSDTIAFAYRFEDLDEAKKYLTTFREQYPNWKIVRNELVIIEVI